MYSLFVNVQYINPANDLSLLEGASFARATKGEGRATLLNAIEKEHAAAFS